MAAEDNKGAGTTGGATGGNTGGQAAGQAKTGGQQISGEQIFTTTEDKPSGDSFATTEAGKTSGATGGASGGGGTGTSGGKDNQTNLSDAVSDAVGGDTGKAKEMLNQAKETTGKFAGQALGQVQEKASTLVDAKTSEFADGLTTIADSVRQFTDSLRSNQQAPIALKAADYGDTLVEQVENLADYLDRADMNKLSRDLESFARKNPAIFIGGAFAAGILLARFIKSSQQRSALPVSRQLTSGSRKSGGRKNNAATATGNTPSLGDAAQRSDDSPSGGATKNAKTNPSA